MNSFEFDIYIIYTLAFAVIYLCEDLKFYIWSEPRDKFTCLFLAFLEAHKVADFDVLVNLKTGDINVATKASLSFDSHNCYWFLIDTDVKTYLFKNEGKLFSLLIGVLFNYCDFCLLNQEAVQLSLGQIWVITKLKCV